MNEEQSQTLTDRAAERYKLLRDFYPIEVLGALGIEAGRNPDEELDAFCDAKIGNKSAQTAFNSMMNTAEGKTPVEHLSSIIRRTQKLMSCSDGYPSCRIAESTGKWCTDQCAASKSQEQE